MDPVARQGAGLTLSQAFPFARARPPELTASVFDSLIDFCAITSPERFRR